MHMHLIGQINTGIKWNKAPIHSRVVSLSPAGAGSLVGRAGMGLTPSSVVLLPSGWFLSPGGQLQRVYVLEEQLKRLWRVQVFPVEVNYRTAIIQSAPTYLRVSLNRRHRNALEFSHFSEYSTWGCLEHTRLNATPCACVSRSLMGRAVLLELQNHICEPVPKPGAHPRSCTHGNWICCAGRLFFFKVGPMGCLVLRKLHKIVFEASRVLFYIFRWFLRWFFVNLASQWIQMSVALQHFRLVCKVISILLFQRICVAVTQNPVPPQISCPSPWNKLMESGGWCSEQCLAH